MTYQILQGDALTVLKTLESESVQCCVTSPPYFGLRDYGCAGQIGLEATPQEFVQSLVTVFLEVRRVMKKDATLWVNLGDSYNGQGERSPSIQTNGDLSYRAGGKAIRIRGLKPKDLMGMPWRVAFALQEAGFWLRQDIIWAKPNPMPESVTDRCTKAHEYIFLLTKSAKYFYNSEAIKEPSTGLPPGNKSHKAAEAYADGDEKHRTKSGLVAYAEKQRDSWKGSEFHTGKTAVHQLERSSKNRDRTVGNRNGEGASTLDVRKHRKPAGWDTGEGSHGTIHRNGRAEEIEYSEIKSETRNKRSVWTVTTEPTPEAHFATFPQKLIEPCILAGSREGDLILDPFTGSGTTGLVALKHRRRYLGIELNPAYIEIAERRLKDVQVEMF